MILAPISAADLADRISILQIKCDRITDPDKLANCYQERQLLREAWGAQVARNDHPVTVGMILKKLDNANIMLWELEDKARIPKYVVEETQYLTQKDKLDMSMLLRAITRTNDTRAAIKRSLNKLLASDIIEEKSHKREA